MLLRYGVVGNPIMHSLSPIIHQCFAQQMGIKLIYERLQGEENYFSALVNEFFEEGGRGLNITLPFKEHAFKIASQCTPRCKEVGAANTLWRQKGVLWADNTDGLGFIKDLARHINLRNKTILLLGAGGSARGIIGPLLANNIAQLCVVNRTREKCERLQQSFPEIICQTIGEISGSFDVMINATAVGTPTSDLLLPEHLWHSKPFCYDLNYNIHHQTPFVAYALAQGCLAIDGLGMLVEQAAESFFIWHQVRPETASVYKQLRFNP